MTSFAQTCKGRNFKALLSAIALLVACGCGKKTVQVADGWSSPNKITDTHLAQFGGGLVYPCGSATILVKPQYSRDSRTYAIMMRGSGTNDPWTEMLMSGISGEYAFSHLGWNESNRQLLFGEGYVEQNQLHMRMLCASIKANGRVQLDLDKRWTLQQESVFGRTGTNVRFNQIAPSERASRENVYLGQAILAGPEVYVPYAMNAHTLFGVNGITNGIKDGPFNVGVFHSADAGKTWEMEQVSDAYGGAPVICQTTGFYYYFAFNYGPWFSRKPASGRAWEKPVFLTKTAMGPSPGVATAEGDTIHFCWVDRRHEDWKLSIDSPYVGNYEIAYTRRKDSDAGWRKELLLSKGLKFSRLPAIAVEGKKLVVAWEGAQDEDVWRAYDLYYVTSKDGGMNWTKPLRATDASKEGISSSLTQLMLKDGVIRLFYAQGKKERGVQARDQAPWPVLYQQKSFPN